MRRITAIVLTGCKIGSTGPAPQESPAYQQTEAVADVAEMAKLVQATAHELTSLVDESRRQVADGRSTPEAEIQKMRALMADIQEQNAALQAAVTAIETNTRALAGDPAPPFEPEKRQR